MTDYEEETLKESAQKPIRVDEFRFTPFDSPLSVFLPEKADWLVEYVSTKSLKECPGTEVHRFRHWTQKHKIINVRIRPPEEA